MKDGAFDPLSLALPGVRAIQPYQPGAAIETVGREQGRSDALKLASNESPLGPSPRALQALAAASGPGIGRYPDNDGAALKHMLAARHGLATDRITLGSGSSETLELALRAFAGHGHEVLYAQYGFAMYPLTALAAGATGVAVPDRDYAQDLEATLQRIGEATRVVFIANPNNPTGAWFNGDALRSFLSRAPRRVLMVIDEAYAEYMESAAPGDESATPYKGYAGYQSAAAWLDEFPNLVVTRSFSKIYGLAGLRIGYALSGAVVADLMNRVRRPFNVNLGALAAACAALEDEDFMRRSCEQNRRSMRRFCGALDALGLEYLAPAGNFVTFTPGAGLSGARVFDAMQRRGVIVRTLDNYGMPGQLRVTMGTDDDMTRCLRALEQSLEELGAGRPAHANG